MTNPKICFITPSVASGGIEMYLLRYLNFIKDTKNITVLARSRAKGELYEEYLATGVQLKFLPLGYLSPPKILQHYKFYKSQDFDVICDFNANFGGIPMLLAKRLKVPKRISFYRQGSDHFNPSFIKVRINKYMNSLIYKNATDILSNSHAALAFFFPYRTSSDSRFQVIYNGVNVKSYSLSESKESIREDLGIPIDAFVLGHVGRLDKAKNHDIILKVFQQIQKEDFKTYLVLCGRNIEKLLPKLKKLGIEEKTIILGYRKDVPRVLKSYDCFLFPSITEGQPNALIEAMVAGIPVVASDIPAIRECVPSSLIKHLKDSIDFKGMAEAVLAVNKENTQTNVAAAVMEKFDSEVNFLSFKKILNG